jgi:hypothetical protein
MKFAQMFVLFLFTATLSSPVFADLDKNNRLSDAEVKEALSETGLSETELETVMTKNYSEAEIKAEFLKSLIKSEVQLRYRINSPMDPENHCEVAKALFADKAIRVFYALKAEEHGVVLSKVDSLNPFLKEALDFAALKSAVCENYY